MATITDILDSDLISASNEVINTNFDNLNSDKIETSYLDTDTALTANSDVKIPTQKAVKAYVDSGGQANASETVRGLVEEATAGEVAAGTATGATGAKLFITPAKVSSIPIATTQLTGVIPTANLPTPAFFQRIPVENGAFTGLTYGFGSNQDGSVFFIYNNSITNSLCRYARDAVTGTYELTHKLDATFSAPDCAGLIVIGTYLYVFSNDGTNIKCSRFLAADLTGEQVMTVPTVACTQVVIAWTDGTYAYVVSSTTPTTSRKWSVSGTTFSASSTATCISMINDTRALISVYDGTQAYISEQIASSLTPKIHKLTDIEAVAITTTTKLMSTLSDKDEWVGLPIINIDTTRMYMGFLERSYDETNTEASFLTLYPISKP